MRFAPHSSWLSRRAPESAAVPLMTSPSILPENSCLTSAPFTSAVKVKRISSPRSRVFCSFTVRPPILALPEIIWYLCCRVTS